MSEKNKGIICMLLSAASFSAMSVAVKLAGDIPTFEKSFFRNLIAAIIAFNIIRKQHIPLSLPRPARIPVLFRSIAGTLGIFANFYAISHMNLADANMLNKLSPFFSILFCLLLLKEYVKPYQIFCVTAAFIGALFILKPGASLANPTAWIALFGGLTAGLAYSLVRVATKKGAQGPIIVLFFSTFSCLASVPLTLLNFKPLSLMQLIFLLLAGLFAAGGQFGITAAYAYAPAREVSVYNYTQIVYSAVFGFLFFKELPDQLSIIGYIFIIGSGIIMFLIGKKQPA